MQPAGVLDMQQTEFALLPIMLSTGPAFTRSNGEWGAFAQGDGHRMYSVQDPFGRMIRAEVINPNGTVWFYQKKGRRMQRCTEEQYAGRPATKAADAASKHTWTAGKLLGA